MNLIVNGKMQHTYQNETALFPVKVIPMEK